MGWTHSNAPATPDEIKREFQSEWTAANGMKITVTDATWGSSGTLWGILRNDGKPIEIMLWLVKRGKYEWGYKDIEESMGPVEVNCPLRLLDLCPTPDLTGQPAEWSRAWRERVRAYHASKRAERAQFKALRVGAYVRLKPGLRAGRILVGDDVGQIVAIGRGRVTVQVGHLDIGCKFSHFAAVAETQEGLPKVKAA